jgi:hypothetical protein
MGRSLYAIVAVAGLALALVGAWTYASGMRATVSPGAPAPVTTASAPSVPASSTNTSATSTSSQSGKSPPAGTEESQTDLTRTGAAGNVALTASLLAPSSVAADPALAETQRSLEAANELGIALSLNTHSGDLSAIDLVAAGTLRTPAGERRPLRWQPTSDDGHHRSGVLVFESTGIDLQGTGDLVLIVRDVGGSPATEFDWTLPLG